MASKKNSIIPGEDQIEARTTDIIKEAQALTITNPEQYTKAAHFLKGVKTLGKEIKATFDEPIKAAHAAHKAIVAAKKKHEGPLLEAESLVKGKISTWTEAESRRMEGEREAKAKGGMEIEEAKRKAEVEALRSAGRNHEADFQESQPVTPPVVKVETETPKVDGVHTQEKWSGEVTSLILLIRYVAEFPDFIHLLKPDSTAINSMARGQKERLRIPGVQAVKKTTVVAAG
jgi:hypothetical protein